MPTIQKYGAGAYGSGGYKGLSITQVDQLHYYALKQIFPIRNLAGSLDDDLTIEGRYLDQVYGPPTSIGQAQLLMNEFFADTTTQCIADYERNYNLPSTGSVAVRQARIIAAKRARGSMGISYFIGLATALGYTAAITEGASLFIVATTSPPATKLPAQLFNPYAVWTWTVTITGVTSAPDLETLFNKLRPAWTLVQYVYA